MTDPFSFVELLMLCMRTGWGSGVVSSWCFCTKLQFMNMPVAPESRSADVEMDAREVREVSSTWTLREWGELFNRMWITVKTHIKFQRSLVKSGSVSNVERSTKSGRVRRK